MSATSNVPVPMENQRHHVYCYMNKCSLSYVWYLHLYANKNNIKKK